MGGPNKLMWILAFSVILACFVGIPSALYATQPPPTDRENCRQDGIIPAHTVVLIDQSDPFTETDVEWVWQLIFDEAKNLKKHGRLTVLGIDADRPDEGLQVFSRCSPGSPSQANPMYENRRFIEQDWQSKFAEDMRAQVEELMLKKQSPQSPLVEHIRGIHRRSDFRGNVKSKRILLISDLYQNSSVFSMYNSGLNKAELSNAMVDVEFPNLEGVELAMFRVDRKRNFKGAEIIEFWREVFADYGLNDIEVVRD